MLFLASCYSNEEVDRPVFEGQWWESPLYKGCFNLSGTNSFLLYEDEYGMYGAGVWSFEEPNVYHVDSYDSMDYKAHVVAADDCWRITSGLLSTKACPCTLF